MKKLFMSIFFTMFILSCGGKKTDAGTNSKKEKSEVILNFDEEAESINPQLTTTQPGMKVNELITEGLTQQDEKGNPVKGLAENWTVSEDGLVWTFTLKENIKWENGDPITAEDFKFGWLNALKAETAAKYAYMLYPIKNAEAFNTEKVSAEEVGIKVVDNKTIEVTLENPTPYFDALVAFPIFGPLNQKFYESVGEQFALEQGTILSSGPYKLVEWVQDSHMVFEKNENYWDVENIKIDRIEAKYVADSAAALAALNNGEIEVIRLTVQQLDELKNDPKLVKSNDGSVWYLEYNFQNKYLANKKIRQALSLAIDKTILTSEILANTGKGAYNLVPAGVTKGLNKDFQEEVGNVMPQFNLEEAKKLLEEGLKEVGETGTLKLSMIFNDSGNNKNIAQYVQESLRKNLNVEIELLPLPFQERVNRMHQKDFEIVLAGWSLDYADPISYLDLFVTGGGNNHTSYSNSRYDELVKVAKTSNDRATRMEAMYELEKIIADDMPIGLLYHREVPYLVSERLKNMGFKAVGSEYYLDNLEVAK